MATDDKYKDIEQIRLLRTRIGLSQAGFAKALGLSVRTVQCWESGRPPGRPGRRLLEILEKAKTRRSKEAS